MIQEEGKEGLSLFVLRICSDQNEDRKLPSLHERSLYKTIEERVL